MRATKLPVLLLALIAACGSSGDGTEQRTTDGGGSDGGRSDGDGGASTEDGGTDSGATDADEIESSDDSGGADAISEAGRGFVTALYGGIWLIGWSGDLDHYAWFRFSPGPGDANGTWSSAPAQCFACDCRSAPCLPERTGTFTVSLPDTILLQSSEDGGSTSYRFGNLEAPSGLVPTGANLAARVDAAGSSLVGYRFPSDRCGADLTGCLEISWVASP